MPKQRDGMTTPRRPGRHDDLHGLDGLTMAELREVARRNSVGLHGLRTKRQVIDKLRSEGLRRKQFRKVPPLRDADPPDLSDPLSLLDYMTLSGPHHAHKLADFPHEQRGVVAVFLERLIDEGLVRAIPESWTSFRWDDDAAVFMTTDEGWAWADRQTARGIRLAVERDHGAATSAALAPSSLEAKLRRLGMSPKIIEAMSQVEQHPDWTDTKIADKVHVHPSTLSRSKWYQGSAVRARGKPGV